MIYSHNFTFLLFIFFTSFTFAQEREYLVNHYNDTIYGKITRRSNLFNKTNVAFKIKDETGKTADINIAEVKTIRSLNGVDGDCFINTIYDRWYLKRIIDGEIKVYILIDNSLYFISKNDSDLTATDIGHFFSREKSHAQIRPLIEDNPEILKEFDLLEGTEKNMLYILETYNKSKK